MFTNTPDSIMVRLPDFLLAPGGGFFTEQILSNDKFSCEGGRAITVQLRFFDENFRWQNRDELSQNRDESSQRRDESPSLQ
ncbi:hypothetical protein N0Y54_38230 [Nostoc punctiforme UO1]|uniref:hypothetical protein n=1 Tax=Nostoc punctiforme TaxID=272131 RepID=UPI00309C06E1